MAALCSDTNFCWISGVTVEYSANVLENLALPWVSDLKADEYLYISASGTLALICW